VGIIEFVTTIRPKISLYAGIGVGLITLLGLISAMVSQSWSSLPSLALSLASIDILVWLFIISPSIKFDDNGVIVTNPIRVLRADWGAIKGFETKFGLTFVTETKKFVAWSAPAPSRREVRRIDRHELKGTSLEKLEFIEPGLTHNSESGSVYWQLDEVRSKTLNTAKHAIVSTNWLGVAALVAALGLAYLGLHY
jgi:hypothetical protein